jgi:N6-L-threonylcarbamoyladenine synthase
MIILAIETSCDETAISILDCEKDTVNVLAHEINSQIELHKEFGGVYPNLARREHGLNCVPVLEQALENAKLPIEDFLMTEDLKNELQKMMEREPVLFELLINFLNKTQKPKFDAIAVTEGPGLEPALWVGITFAKALSLAWNLPIISVNHMEGHIVSALLENTTQKNSNLDSRIRENNKRDEEDKGNNLETIFQIQEIKFPAISLLVSGGHTELVKIDSIGNYEVVGRTRDDAVGEAFDKVARLLGYPYPGGPEVSALAEKARNSKHEIRNNIKIQNDKTEIKLPRPMLHSKDLDFSFSGIKTAVLYMIQKISVMTEEIKMEIAKEFEDAVIEVLVAKTKKAIETYGAKTLIVGGGVIANKPLRKTLVDSLPQTKVLIPNIKLTTDNATMIGVAGYLKINRSNSTYSTDLRAQGGMSLGKN